MSDEESKKERVRAAYEAQIEKEVEAWRRARVRWANNEKRALITLGVLWVALVVTLKEATFMSTLECILTGALAWVALLVWSVVGLEARVFELENPKPEPDGFDALWARLSNEDDS